MEYIFIPLFYLITFKLNHTINHVYLTYSQMISPEPYSRIPDILHYMLPEINRTISIKMFGTNVAYLFFSYVYNDTDTSLINLQENTLTLITCIVVNTFIPFLTIAPACIREDNKPLINQLAVYFAFLSSITNSNVFKYMGYLSLISSRQYYTIEIIETELLYFYLSSIYIVK